MALAGCLGSTEPFLKLKSRQFRFYSLEPTWILSPSDAQLGEEITYVLGIKQEGEGGWTIDATVLQPNFSPSLTLSGQEIDNGYQPGSRQLKQESTSSQSPLKTMAKQNWYQFEAVGDDAQHEST